MPQPVPTMADHALGYLAQGLSVFPVCSPTGSGRCLQHGKCANAGKVPLIKWEALQDALPTHRDVERWWKVNPSANIGMATGTLSGRVVLDCDSGEARKEAMQRGVPGTPAVWTGKPGGCHFHLKHPGRPLQNFARKLPGLDFRGDGGYVLLPPSKHESGAVYRWVDTTPGLPLAPVPDWLNALFERRELSVPDGGHEPLDLLKLLDGIPDGQRNDALFRYACKMRGDDIPLKYAELTISQGAQLCRPPYTEVDPLEIVRRVYREYPAGHPDESKNGQRPHDAPAGTRLDVVRMSDVTPEPIEWLWRGRFARGKPTLLMGDPGLGKSLITHWMAATISTGAAWPDGDRCERGSAILFTTEDALADTVAPRLIAAGADMGRVLAVRGVIDDEADPETKMFALIEHLMLLEQLILESGAIFVAMDPITAYLGPDVNSHKEADVRRVLGPVSLLAERTRVVLAMLMHLNKGTGVSALYRSTGSIAFPAVARAVLGVAPDPNDEQRRLLLPVKMNIGKLPEGIGYRIETSGGKDRPPVLSGVGPEDQPPVLLWDLEPVTIRANEALDSSGSAVDRTMKAEVKTVLQQILLPGTRRPSRECWESIKKETGCQSGSIVTAAKNDLGIRSGKDQFTGAWYWEMPERTMIPHENGMESLESTECSGLHGILEDSIPIEDSEDSIDSIVGNRARARGGSAGDGPRACLDCGRPTPHAYSMRCEPCMARHRNIPQGEDLTL